MQPEVEIRSGRLRGALNDGIHSFRGVPYAAPTDGPRRFQPPAPRAPWIGTLDATRPGDAAPQLGIPGFGFVNLAGRRNGEDCLSLNVWTPGLDDARRPVLVWIHGGGFLVGSGSTPLYDGHDLARRGDLVVVTINYRLGALGFAHLGLIFGDAFAGSTNLGLRDQIAALEWVHDNIERFGGDPGNVTVFGQSAGAMSIGALLGAPRARARMHRAICQSGAADHVIDAEAARRVARSFVEALGGPPASPAVLGRIPMEQILTAQRVAMRKYVSLHDELMAFLPAVDGDVIPEPPLEALRRGAARDIPLMVGTTLDEWKLFRILDSGPLPMRERALHERLSRTLSTWPNAPRPEEAATRFREAVATRSGRTAPGEVWSAFQSARVFHRPAARLAAAHNAGGGSTHVYLFTWRAPSMRNALGACHAIDIPFVFGATHHPLARPLTGFSREARRLSRGMQRAWIGFAHEGTPGHARLPGWSRWDPAQRVTMVLGRTPAADRGPLDAQCALLDQWAGEDATDRAEELARA